MTQHSELWGEQKPVVGVLHLLPLPGSPRWRGSFQEVLDRASREAATLAAAGLDGLVVENFGDVPFHPGPVPPETVAAMTAVAREVGAAVSIPVGVNVLRNDALAAMGVALASGGAFIRVNVHTGSMFTDQGLLEGAAHATLRKRAELGAPVSILADVLVKHATPPPGLSLEAAAADAWYRGLADALILTGSATGAPVDVQDVERARTVLPQEAPLWIGSGASQDTVGELLELADGIIVGSALRRSGRAGEELDPARVDAFVKGLRPRSR